MHSEAEDYQIDF